MRIGDMVYWRFKGEMSYRFGFVSSVGRGLIRMGYYNGDYDHGPIVDPRDIEIK